MVSTEGSIGLRLDKRHTLTLSLLRIVTLCLCCLLQPALLNIIVIEDRPVSPDLIYIAEQGDSAVSDEGTLGGWSEIKNAAVFGVYVGKLEL